MFDEEFYPTPYPIARRMLEKLSPEVRHFLEPSAGKGDLADAIKASDRHATVDCIEHSPELVAILAKKGYPIVGHDWLDYSGVSYYDAIVMNPPFSNGDDHLLRAWDFLHSGEIVCLLNAETVNNPHTASRKRLKGIIEQYGSVELLGDCFRQAERKTGVEVALVHLKKVGDDDAVDLWERSTEEKGQREDGDTPDWAIAVRDELGNLQHHYDMANDHMFQAFRHIRKAAVYMAANGIQARDYEQVLALSVKNVTDARAEFSRKHRRDAWMNVFGRMEFRKWLDKKQTDEFIRDIERNGNVPFTKENIRGTLGNVILQRGRLFEKSVANVYDELTRYFNGNTNHTEGWKSNDNFKVNQKLVFPYGCDYNPLWGFSKRYSGSSIDIYNDLDRVLCVLSGEDFETCRTVSAALDDAFRAWNDRNNMSSDTKADSRFFGIQFFKKGTVHLKFKDKALWQRFNVTAAKGKNWVGQET